MRTYHTDFMLNVAFHFNILIEEASKSCTSSCVLNLSIPFVILFGVLMCLSVLPMSLGTHERDELPHRRSWNSYMVQVCSLLQTLLLQNIHSVPFSLCWGHCCTSWAQPLPPAHPGLSFTSSLPPVPEPPSAWAVAAIFQCCHILPHPPAAFSSIAANTVLASTLLPFSPPTEGPLFFSWLWQKGKN
jgi:hypothetical protein